MVIQTGGYLELLVVQPVWSWVSCVIRPVHYRQLCIFKTQSVQVGLTWCSKASNILVVSVLVCVLLKLFVSFFPVLTLQIF